MRLTDTATCIPADSWAGIVSNTRAAAAQDYVRGPYPQCGGSRRRGRFSYTRSLYRKAKKRLGKTVRRRKRGRGRRNKRKTRVSHAYGASQWPIFKNNPLTKHRGGDGQQFSQCRTYGLGSGTDPLWGRMANPYTPTVRPSNCSRTRQ